MILLYYIIDFEKIQSFMQIGICIEKKKQRVAYDSLCFYYIFGKLPCENYLTSFSMVSQFSG